MGCSVPSVGVAVASAELELPLSIGAVVTVTMTVVHGVVEPPASDALGVSMLAVAVMLPPAASASFCLLITAALDTARRPKM